MSPWGWSPERSQGIWRHGAVWTRPFVAASPWLMLLVLLLQFHIVGSTLLSSRGVLFDLPSEGLAEGERTDLVALVLPKAQETLVFFDDSRYQLGDATSVAALKEHLAECAARTPRKAVLVLADRRVAGGELMKLAAIAKKSGLERILFAEKRAEKPE